MSRGLGDVYKRQLEVSKAVSAAAAATQHQPGDQHQSTQADHGVDPVGVWRPEQPRNRGCHRSQTSRSTTNKAPTQGRALAASAETVFRSFRLQQVDHPAVCFDLSNLRYSTEVEARALGQSTFIGIEQWDEQPSAPNSCCFFGLDGAWLAWRASVQHYDPTDPARQD